MTHQIFTFGSNHIGELSGNLGHSYMKVEGNFSEARAKVFEFTGGVFSFQYDSEEEAGVFKFGLREVPLQRVHRDE